MRFGSLGRGAKLASGRDCKCVREGYLLSRSEYLKARRAIARSGPYLAALLASGVVAVRAWRIAPGGDESIVQAMPDNAFYYLVQAKHFATSLAWTFDGVRPATGFHLVWAYLLAAFYRVWPQPTLVNTFVFGAVVACLCHGIAAYAVARKLSQIVPSAAAVAATITVFCVGTIPATGTFCTATPSMLLAAALTCVALTSDAVVTRRSAALLIVLGVAGTFCRTDYIILPAAFAFAQALLVRPRSWRGMVSTPAAICLEGAILGFLLVAAHTFMISGAVVQASVATKARWSSILGHDLDPALAAMGRVLSTGLSESSLLAVSAGIGVCACVALWLARHDRQRMQLALAGSAASVAYVFAYAHNTVAIPLWYAGSFALPLLLLLAVVLGSIPRRAIALPIAVMMISGVSQQKRTELAPWPHQLAPMLAGVGFAQGEPPGSTGAWNAGVLSFFSGGRIVNLDGLANDDVLDFARRNEMLAYIAREHILRVADFGAMIADRTARKLGGYDSPMMDDCVTQIGQLDKKYELRWNGSEYGVYEFDFACLKAGMAVTADAVSRSK